MMNDHFRLAPLVDGANFRATTWTLGFEIDFNSLLKASVGRGQLVRALDWPKAEPPVAAKAHPQKPFEKPFEFARLNKRRVTADEDGHYCFAS